MLNTKTEEEKLAELNKFLKPIIEQNPRWLDDKVCRRQVRWNIRDIWGLKKSAANEKFNKLFVFENGAERGNESDLRAIEYLIGAKKLNDGLNQPVEPLMRNIRLGFEKNSPQQNVQSVVKSNLTGDKITAEVKGVDSIKTIDDLIVYCKIDLNKWEPKTFVPSLQRGVLNFRAEFKKRLGGDTQRIIEDAIKSLKEYSPFVKTIHSKSVDNNDLMLEVVLADVHLGRLCWPEAGEDTYSLKIARDLVFQVIHDMAEKAKRFGKYSKVLLWIAGDYLNVDNEENTTTALTSQSVDSRFPKVFKEGKDILVEVINYLKEIAPVDVVITRGNHDFNSMFHMGEVIEAYFHNDENVVVDNSPAPRKYYKFGQNLIQFCHGDKIDIKKLPSIMAAEAASDWGSTKWHECHSAHRHHESLIVNETANCKTRVMNTIAGVDGYHATHGYVQNIRCAQSFIWNKDFGLQALVYSEPIQ